MVRGPPVVFEVCPCSPSKHTKVKIKLKWITYHTIAESLRVWKWHMAIAVHCSPSTDISLNLIPYPSTDFPLYSHQQKRGLSAMNVVFLAIISLHICRCVASVSQPMTTRIHNRGPNYWNFHVFMTLLIVLPNPSLHTEIVTYCTSYTNNHQSVLPKGRSFTISTRT